MDTCTHTNTHMYIFYTRLDSTIYTIYYMRILCFKVSGQCFELIAVHPRVLKLRHVYNRRKLNFGIPIPTVRVHIEWFTGNAHSHYIFN